MNAPRSCALIACLLFSSLLAVAEEAWITSWTVSPELAEPAPKRRIVNLEDQTVRELVRISVGGSQIRVHLSNECDTVTGLVLFLPLSPRVFRSFSQIALWF